jgi:hypothetical protein
MKNWILDNCFTKNNKIISWATNKKWFINKNYINILYSEKNAPIKSNYAFLLANYNDREFLKFYKECQINILIYFSHIQLESTYHLSPITFIK